MSRALAVKVTNGDEANDKTVIYENIVLEKKITTNVSRYGEDISWAYHIQSPGGAGNKTNEVMTVFVDGKEIVLNRFTANNFYCALESKYSNALLAPFKIGQMYLISMYVYAENNQWFLMRTLATTSTPAHDYRLANSKRVNRVWMIGKATSTSLLDLGGSATVILGNGTGASPCLVYQAHQSSFDAYIGGVQIEAIDNSYVDGIAVIGDSTFAVSSGSPTLDLGRNFDTLDNLEVTHTLAAVLNCSVFNRAVAGERLDQMDARWAADITSIKPRCKYVLIQGGINDIGQGRTLAQMKTSIQSMIAKSVSDGFTDYILVNITPNLGCEQDAAKEALRQQFNNWLLATYPTKCKDIASVVADPLNLNKLRAEYYNDGIHYIGAAKFAVATYLASVCDFRFIKPSAYQRTDPKFILNTWKRESTIVVAAGASILGANRRVISSAGLSGETKNAPKKFAALGGSNLTGIVAIQASSDSGTTWYPVAQTTMTQLNGAGNFGGYVEVPIVETVMRGVLVNTSGSTQSNVVLSTKIS